MKQYPNRILVSHIEHIKAALTAADRLGITPTLQTSAELLAFAGAPFIAVLAAEAAKSIFVADTGEYSGHAMALIRLGVKHIIFSGDAESQAQIESIASQNSALLVEQAKHMLDLSQQKNPLQACMSWLASR